MIVSLNWLKEYLDIDLPADKVGEILTDIGLEVEGQEEVESIPGGLEGLVIGKVVTCGKHPNADRLSVTTVDVGGDELLHIVCGAPNVAAGQKVVVAPPGTTLHPTDGEPFKIKKAKVRGEVSEGMICAEDEIGLGTDHDGIMVLPEEVTIGQAAREYYKIEKDTIFEIGLTPNRSDATSHIGVARDLAAALKINYNHNGELKLPDVSGFKPDNTDLPVNVIVEDSDACPRYAGLSFDKVEVKESPDWMQRRLRAIGLRPINNIVDITNYVLHEYGQPLHAFDLDAIKGHTIRVKTLKAGTSFLTLDEQQLELKENDLMICNGESEGMCMAGVYGGLHSGVTEKTTRIFLESAHFSPTYIRRSSMGHQLRTDAARVFEKGSDPNIVVTALKRAAMLFGELAGASIASELVDIYPAPIEPKKVKVEYQYVNTLIGVELEKERIHDILEAMDMEIVESGDQSFTVAVPTDKADVTRPADVVEEIVRIYGLNEIPFSDQVRSSLSYYTFPDSRVAYNTISDILAGNGFSEMMAVSLSESRYYKEILPIQEEELVFVNNTSNVTLDIMRPTMLFSGLEAVVHNLNRQQTDLSLFEFGRTYLNTEKGYEEESHLSLFLTGNRRPESWRYQEDSEVDFYTLKGYVVSVLQRLGLEGYQETSLQDDVFTYGVRYHRGPKVLVEFGQVQKGICQKMDVRQPVFYADFHWDNLVAKLHRQKVEFEELNKYPTVRRDLALVVEDSVKFSDIVGIARKTGKKLIKDINLFDVYDNEEQLGAGKKSYAVSYLFEDPTKTLKDKEVDKVMEQLIREYEQKIGATIRR